MTAPPRRSDATRAGILRAARSRFAADGYQRATIRAIAADAAAARMRTVFRDQLAPVLLGLVGDKAEAAQRAGLVATQMLGLALCRHDIRVPPGVALDTDTVVARIGPTIQRYLTGPLP